MVESAQSDKYGLRERHGIFMNVFFILAGGFVVILIPVVISVVSAVVSGVAAAVEDEED